MVSVNPFAQFRVACDDILRNALARLFPEISVSFVLGVPPSSEFGELSSSVCFELARSVRKKPLKIAEQIVKSLDLSDFPLVSAVKAAGGGYVNFYVDMSEFAELTLASVLSFDQEYGFVKAATSRKIIVEHTSVNPVHPIHIGTTRNSVLGDSLARILMSRGHTVYRHYYVDDVGRQGAVIAYGYKKLGEPEPEGKPDHFIGMIYSITSCIVEVQKLKKSIETGKKSGDEEAFQRWQRKLDDLTAVAAELQSVHPKLFNQLLERIAVDVDPDAKVAELNLEYERGEKEAKRLVRKVSELCLDGFKQSLGRLGIFYDSWDWESDFVWNSDARKTLSLLEKTPYVFRAGEVLEFNAERAAQDLGLKPLLGLREEYEVPSLTLVRADGTTLYTTRDIPYNLWKFGKADQVINVIGMEQTLAQIHLKVALAALGYLDKVRNLRHFAYNLVRLPEHRMSGRMGRYVTLDETADEAVGRAFEEVVKRSPNLPETEKQQISGFVGIGALKYALVQVDPAKPVVFTWDRVLDFERNSAPYIQYSCARAYSILRKAGRKPEHPDYALLKEPIERDLILTLARFPDIFIDSAESLRPNQIADYANSLADKFNSFYNAWPVIKAEPAGLSDARLMLVNATLIVLRNAVGLLGIEAPERM